MKIMHKNRTLGMRVTYEKSGHPISEVAAVVRFFPKMKHSSLISGSKIGIIA